MESAWLAATQIIGTLLGVIAIFGYFTHRIQNQIDSVQNRIDKLDDKLGKLDDKFSAQMNGIRAEMKELNEKFHRLDKEVHIFIAVVNPQYTSKKIDNTNSEPLDR